MLVLKVSMIKESDVVRSQYLIISVIGSHAGEGLADIFARKRREIERVGKSYWLVQSRAAGAQQVQDLCAAAGAASLQAYCLFIEPAQSGGARPTSSDALAAAASSDNRSWEAIPEGISVTGKIGRSSVALVFDEIVALEAPVRIDLWEYSKFGTGEPVRLALGASTVCCERAPSQGMKSHHRRVVGVGRLAYPHGLWLR